jgi:hypothetical protein
LNYIYLTVSLLKDLFHVDISRREEYPEPGAGDLQDFRLPDGLNCENPSSGWGMKML